MLRFPSTVQLHARVFRAGFLRAEVEEGGKNRASAGKRLVMPSGSAQSSTVACPGSPQVLQAAAPCLWGGSQRPGLGAGGCWTSQLRGRELLGLGPPNTGGRKSIPRRDHAGRRVLQSVQRKAAEEHREVRGVLRKPSPRCRLLLWELRLDPAPLPPSPRPLLPLEADVPLPPALPQPLRGVSPPLSSLGLLPSASLAGRRQRAARKAACRRLSRPRGALAWACGSRITVPCLC